MPGAMWVGNGQMPFSSPIPDVEIQAQPLTEFVLGAGAAGATIRR